MPLSCNRSLTRAAAEEDTDEGGWGLCLVTITTAAPLPSPNIVECTQVQPSPSTKLSWLMSRVCQVSQQCATCVQC